MNVKTWERMNVKTLKDDRRGRYLAETNGQ